jgi:stalled ribosome rescue protein Dom34
MVVEEGYEGIDNLLDEVTDYGTDLLIFSPQTESGAQLKSFGGIAARLRW